MNTLGKGPMGLIGSGVSYFDAYCLRMTCRNAREYVHQDLRKIIDDRIPLRGRPSGKELGFSDLLLRHGHYLSGSFILQCIFNETWDRVGCGGGDSDIDVYVMEKDAPGKIREYKDFTHTEGYLTEFTRDITRDIDLVGEYESDFIDDSHTYGPFSVKAYNFWLSSGLIQLNYIKIIQESPHENVPQFIDHCSDFAFCKVYFDGNKLHIKSIDSLIHRKCTFNIKNVDINYEKNVGNFGRRLLFRENFYVKLMKNRIKKYRVRGFTINLHPETQKALDRYDSREEYETHQHMDRKKWHQHWIDDWCNEKLHVAGFRFYREDQKTDHNYNSKLYYELNDEEDLEYFEDSLIEKVDEECDEIEDILARSERCKIKYKSRGCIATIKL